MRKHKLFSLLSTFSRKEMTRFYELARSPYHNKHPEIERLVERLSELYPAFEARNCTRERLWKKLFGEVPLDTARLAVLFTYTWRLAEVFLALEEGRSQERDDQLAQLRALRRRRQSTLFSRQLQRVETDWESQPQRDSAYYLDRYRLASEADTFFLGAERQADYLPRRQEYLDHFYLVEKLRDAVEMQVRRQMLRGEYATRLLEAVLQEVGCNPQAYANVPAVQVYYALYQMMHTPQPEHYQQALLVFQAHQPVFGAEEIADIYNYFQNFCIARINLDERSYLRELFELYQEQLGRQLLREDGFLPEWHYKNIVTVALRLRELEWAHHFIEHYRQELTPAAADNAYRFNLAAYHHAAGNYGEVLALLTQVEYSDVRYNIGAKALLLRTYYELNENDALFALVDSFRQYLQRNRLLADERRAGTYQLFRFTRRIAAIRAEQPYAEPAHTQQALARLKHHLAHAGAVFNRAWLEEKVRQLEVKLDGHLS